MEDEGYVGGGEHEHRHNHQPPQHLPMSITSTAPTHHEESLVDQPNDTEQDEEVDAAETGPGLGVQVVPVQVEVVRPYQQYQYKLSASPPEYEIDRIGTIFHEVAYSQLEVVMKMVETEPDLIHATDNLLDATPLYWACIYGRDQTAMYLIDQGSDVNAVNKNGYSVMYAVCRYDGNPALLKKLISRGAGRSLFLRDMDGRQPIEYCKEEPRTFVLKECAIHRRMKFVCFVHILKQSALLNINHDSRHHKQLLVLFSYDLICYITSYI